MRNLVIRIFIFFAANLFASSAYAQNCGCAEEGNCPENIAAVDDFNICYTFTDAFNDNLADPSQGVCGVNLTFSHDYIYDLEITLISPSGQEVRLVGANTMGSGGTSFTVWEVLFLPCSDTAEPAGAFDAVWSNDQNWPFVGAIGGSYYPNTGCLEDFNTGPVNGQWCLNINSQSFPGVVGTVADFEVVMCDQSGIFCCDADGGDLDDDLTACEGDGSLVLNLEPEYVGFPPDDTEYGYTYLIGEIGGLLLEASETPDLSAYAPGDYEVCGLSYDLAEATQVPTPDGVLSMQEIKDDLNGLNPSFCGSLSNDCFPVTITSPIAPTALADTICVGNTYTIGDSTFTEAGDYAVIFIAPNLCDSLVNLSLAVLPVDTAYVTKSICLGDSFTLADSVFFNTGNYEVFVAGNSRCDSVYLVDLTVIAPVIENVNATICEGESYLIGTNSYSTIGLYQDTIPSFLTGCDSIVNLDLDVISVDAQIADPDTITCADPTIILDGSASSSGPGVTYEWIAEAGGVIVPPNNQNTVEVSDNGIYKLRVTQSGCTDSVSVSVLQITDIPLADAGQDTVLTCANPTIQLDGTGSDNSADLEYTWTTSDGNILPGEENSLTPTITLAPATYVLRVRNILTECEDSSAVFVDADNTLPPVEAGQDAMLNCANSSVTLDASASFIDNEHTYVWTDTDANVLIQALQTDVNQIGTYYFTITKIATGCASIDSVSVTESFNLPIVDAGETDSLTCAESSTMLNGTVNNSVDFSIEWTGPGFIQNPTTLNPTVDTPGWFYLNVTDDISECTAVDSVFISEVGELPNADAGNGAPILDCQTTEVTLGDPQDTSQGDQFTYEWFVNNVAVFNDLEYTVNAEGTYILTVTNNDTGCSRSDTIEVSEFRQEPTAEAGTGGELNCEVFVINFFGTESGPLPDDAAWINYTWYNENDEIVSTEQGFDAYTPGDYYLVIDETISYCRDTAYVSVTQDPNVPLAEAGDTITLDCISSSAVLDGTGSSTGDFSYSWSGPAGATILNGNTLMPTVNQPGTYVLEVNRNDINCLSADATEVVIDTADCVPVVVVNPGFELFADGENGIVDCTSEDDFFVSQVGQNFFLDTLDASATPLTNSDLEASWSALNGFIIDDSNPQFPIVTAGTFVLTVTNTLLNISAADTITVLDIRNFPNANAGQDAVLNCNTLQSGYILDGSVSDQGPNFTYEWVTEDGDFEDSDLTTLDPVVYTAGFYELTVTDNSNGCSSTEGVLIDINGQIPAPCFISQVQMECTDQSVMIGDTCDINPNYTYSWSILQDGTIIGNPNQASIQVQTDTSMVSALFQVVVTDVQNFCTFTDTVEVFTAVNCSPTCVVSTPAPIITCNQASITLDATGSSTGAEFAYEWENVGGVGGFCGGTNDLQVCIDTEGTYQFTVTNTETGFTCQSQSVFIDAQTENPPVNIDASQNPAFTCNDNTVILTAESDDTGTYAFAWSSGTNCIVSPTDLPQIEVICATEYALTVTNLLTGCENISTITIDYDTLPPATVVLNSDNTQLGCTNPQAILNGSGTSQADYSWTLDGDILIGETGLSYFADMPGEYCLIALNPENGCSDSICIVVTENPDAVFADAGENQFLGCAGGSVQLTGDAPSGPNFTFEWTTDAGVNCFFPTTGSLNITASCPGTYTLTVTDTDTGCQGVSSVEVIDDSSPPEVNAGPDRELDCQITQVVLDGSASQQGDNLTYNWVGMPQNPVPGETPLTPIAVAPGMYTLLIFNQTTSCFAIDTVYVNQTAFPPEANAGEDGELDCITEEIDLDGTGTPQNDSLSYLWTSATGTGIQTSPELLSISVNEPGEYYLTVTNDSTACSQIDTVAVTIDTIAPTPAVLIENNALLDCNIDTISLDASASTPADDLTFQWSGSTGGIISPFNAPEIDINAPGIYLLQITNTINGCEADTSVMVTGDFTPPSIVIAEPETLTCLIESVILDAGSSQANSTFAWSSADNLPIENETTSNPTIFNAGDYLLTLSSEINGCPAEETITVQEDVTAPTAVATAQGSLDCVTNSVVLSGQGSDTGNDFSYEWQGPQAVSTPFNLETEVFAAGLYDFIVTDTENGCADTAQVEVITGSLPITDADISIEMPDCINTSGGSIVVNTVTGGNAPYFYSFNEGAFSQYNYRNNLSPGEYLISIEDAEGCAFDTTLVINEPPMLMIDLGPDIELNRGDSTELSLEINLSESALDTIIWRPLPDENCPGCPQQMLTPFATTAVSVEVRDTFGCTAFDDIFIYVIGGENSPVFIPNAFSPNGDGQNDLVQVFGNPELVNIDLFQIFDRRGSLVFEAKDFSPESIEDAWDGNFRGQEMNSQVFAWRVEYTFSATGKKEVEWGDISLIR